MIQPEINKIFTPEQVADFILSNDKENVFASAKLNKEEFVQAIRRLNDLGFLIVFNNNNEIWGTLGWFFLTEQNKHEASKAIWRLPDNLIDGDILYLSFISTKGNCDVLAIKKMFEDMGYRKRITKRRGFTKGKWYEKKVAQGDRNA